MTHTPTPWSLGSSSAFGISIWGAHGHVADVKSWDGETRRDNAAYIVHCVNSHASLVEENKRMRELARRSLEMAKVMEGMTGCRGDDEWVWGLMDDLKSAIGDTNA